MKIWLTLIIISFTAMAQDNSVCIPIAKDPIHDFHDLHKHLEWHGANSAQIEKAFCKTLSPPTTETIDKLIKSRESETTSAVINGISFKDENPTLINAFEAFTTAKDGFGISAKANLQQDFQKLYSINPQCDKVRCAMEKIWGKKLAEKILYLNLKHNYNASEFAFENSDRFTVEELDDVIMGMDDLPLHLTPMGNNNQRLTHFKRGYTLQAYGPNVAANAVIMLFDSWDAQPRREKQYSIFHEASHNTSGRLKDMDESPEWLELSSWVKTGDDWSSDPKACQITKYGATNPWEDFAETMSTYRYNPHDFKNKCPDKYDFMKDKVFKGIEYTDNQSCGPLTNDQIKLAQDFILKDISSNLVEKNFSPDDVKKNCVNIFSYPTRPEEINQCSIKLMTLDQANAATRLDMALHKAHVPDIQANRDLILDGINELLKNDLDLQRQMITLAKGIPESIEFIKEESIKVANINGSGSKTLLYDSYVWRSNQDQCLSQVLDGVVREDFTRCHLKTIINKDRESQPWNLGFYASYKAPTIFKQSESKRLEKEREAALENELLNQEVTKQAMQKIEKDIKSGLSGHLLHVSVLLYDIPKWKKLTPVDFCAQTYAKSSSAFLALNVQKGTLVPSIQKWCVAKQAESKNRREFTEAEWNEYTSSLFK